MIKVKAKIILPDYPCIMIVDDDELVLFTSPNTGTVVASPIPDRVGYYTNTWWEHKFTPWYGIITLTQEM